MARRPRIEMASRRRVAGALALVLVVAACGRTEATVGGSSSQATNSPVPQTPLTMLIRTEPVTLTSRVSGGSGRVAQGIFNAGLAYRDSQDVPHPYLAEELPRLGTDS